jgi:hypothetical protein
LLDSSLFFCMVQLRARVIFVLNPWQSLKIKMACNWIVWQYCIFIIGPHIVYSDEKWKTFSVLKFLFNVKIVLHHKWKQVSLIWNKWYIITEKLGDKCTYTRLESKFTRMLPCF